MAGARFVRADLHVHTYSDKKEIPPPALTEYVEMAVAEGISILGITDHNSTSRVEEVLAAAKGHELLVLPGIEVTTNEGHLLALFSPDRLEDLRQFASSSSLRLAADPRDGSLRSNLGLLALVEAVGELHGLAILAHIDASPGLNASVNATTLASLMCSRHLAGIEFRDIGHLREWFLDGDTESSRLEAWRARQRSDDLRRRGLARIMSSDAHAPSDLGKDRTARTLTRLRVDDLNFDAVWNAVVESPRARCKAEPDLPPSYAHVRRVQFTGGFLDGLDVELSPNLNCFIGGRGSGKSTALIALRAALGQERSPAAGDNADDPTRMPELTRVEFTDAMGSERVAIRRRGQQPVEEGTDLPISLRTQGLGQYEAGRLASDYEQMPDIMTSFLDRFVDLRQEEEREHELLAELSDNAAEVERTQAGLSELPAIAARIKELERQLLVAQNSRLDEIADWARYLASEAPFLDRISQAIATYGSTTPPAAVDLDRIASETSLDLNDKRVKPFIEGAEGLRARLAALGEAVRGAARARHKEVTGAREPVTQLLAQWQAKHDELKGRLEVKQQDLAKKGLRAQAGQVRTVASELERFRKRRASLLERKVANTAAWRQRAVLLEQLHQNRDHRFERRRAKLRELVREANQAAGGLTIHVRHHRAGSRAPWEDWLRETFHFRSPRVERVGEAISPRKMAQHIRDGGAGLEELEAEGDRFFSDPNLIAECLPRQDDLQTIFRLETLLLEDRVVIEVGEQDPRRARPFSDLSLGQQHSVLLSLSLCGGAAAPLVVDQPEDHLDAQYIASSLVGHLEAVKEKRQIIVATHSANVTVLGDAELVVPLQVSEGRSRAVDPGAADRPATRALVCGILEGGEDAYQRRGRRYGVRFAEPPARVPPLR